MVCSQHPNVTHTYHGVPFATLVHSSCTRRLRRLGVTMVVSSQFGVCCIARIAVCAPSCLAGPVNAYL